MGGPECRVGVRGSDDTLFQTACEQAFRAETVRGSRLTGNSPASRSAVLSQDGCEVVGNGLLGADLDCLVQQGCALFSLTPASEDDSQVIEDCRPVWVVGGQGRLHDRESLAAQRFGL